MNVIKQTIISELQQKIAESRMFRNKIQTAKTKTKRNFYLKKLRKNNNLVAELIIALEQINRELQEDAE